MKKLFFIMIGLIDLMTLSVKAECNVRFATAFTDNMVLQQQSVVKIWGYARPSETISLVNSWNKTKVRTQADSQGKWVAELKTPKGGNTEQLITLTNSASESIFLKNILIGEVWLCSGQSNMEMVLQSMPEWNLIVENSAAEIAKANFPNIRFLTLGRKESFTVQTELYSSGWKVCTPENVKWVSAVAYFFGRKIHQNLQLPVGLVISSYGGSPIQSWIPEDQINSKEMYKPEKENKDTEINVSNQTEEEYIRAMSDWIVQSEKKTLPKSNQEITLTLPLNLEKSKVGNQLGEVLFSKKIYLPNKNEGLDLTVNLGQIDDLGSVYFNGELVWQEIRNSKSYSQIQFTIPAANIKQDQNLIEVKVLNILWGGGLTGPADKMYYTAGANTEKISLTGDWNYEKVFDLLEVNPIPREGKPLFSTASSLYNGMIYPLLGFTFKGCLWYQGEGNVGDNRYTQMFTDMIEAWRNNFNQNMPFYFVQIAPYNYDNLPQGDKSVLLREMQAKTAKNVPQTYMAVTIDIGEADNIHPAKKKEVGERLALLALSKTYQQNLSCDYPQAFNAEYKNKSVIVNLTNTYKGLVLSGDKHELEISNDDKTYFTTQVELNGNQLIAKSDLLSNPKYIRYCWHNISKGTIFNSEGLPLTSFKLEIK